MDVAAEPPTPEAIDAIEKKMNMTLDDIINMSNKKKPPHLLDTKSNVRVSNYKSLQKPSGRGSSSCQRLRRFAESRCSLRQEALSQRRSTFQFPLMTSESDHQFANNKAMAASVAPAAHVRNRLIGANYDWNETSVLGAPPVEIHDLRSVIEKKKKKLQQRNQTTLDSLFFAHINKEHRMHTTLQHNIARRPRRNYSGAAASHLQEPERIFFN